MDIITGRAPPPALWFGFLRQFLRGFRVLRWLLIFPSTPSTAHELCSTPNPPRRGTAGRGVPDRDVHAPRGDEGPLLLLILALQAEFGVPLHQGVSLRRG